MADTIPDWDKPSSPAQNVPDWDRPSAPQEKPGFAGQTPAEYFSDPSHRRNLGKDIGAFAYGRGTSVLGAPGDIEQFATTTVPKWFGAKEPLYDASKLFGDTSRTFFPTSEQIKSGLKSVGIEKPSEESRAFETAGELSPLAASVPSLVKGGVKLLAGETSKIGEESAKLAEKMGFKVSAPQVARTAPTTQRGAVGFEKANQELANKYASQATGKESNFVDEKFLKERFKDLGNQFDKIYKGKIFNIDQPAVSAIQTILANENAAIGPSGVSSVKSAAEDIIKGFRTHTASGAAPNTFGILGEGLQRLRNALSAKAGSTSGQAAHEIYELIDEIDASIARNHPDVAEVLNNLRPKYRAAVVLEDLTTRGGIDRGDVSLARLGSLLEGSSIRRKVVQGIDALGQIGRDNKLIALWERPGEVVSEAGQTAKSALDALGLGRIGRALTLPARTSAARSAQRFYATPPETTLGSYLQGGLSPFGKAVVRLSIPATVARSVDEEKQ